jgi:hypothetical protein
MYNLMNIRDLDNVDIEQSLMKHRNIRNSSYKTVPLSCPRQARELSCWDALAVDIVVLVAWGKEVGILMTNDYLRPEKNVDGKGVDNRGRIRSTWIKECVSAE